MLVILLQGYEEVLLSQKTYAPIDKLIKKREVEFSTYLKNPKTSPIVTGLLRAALSIWNFKYTIC